MSDVGRTLIEIVRERATDHPAEEAYSFLRNGENEIATLTFGELDLRARAVAALLNSVEARDERVLLVYPPGLDFIVGFLGCFYARAVAVPVPAPRFNRATDRLSAIASDCGARIVVTTRSILSGAGQSLKHTLGLESRVWLTTDDVELQLADDWRMPSVHENTLAFLQYTSGSTMTPRGVMVTHGNLLHNERLIQKVFNQDSKSVILSWLPHYHDMGLIGGALQPLYLGAKCILMPPLAFLERPIRWLRAITNYGVTTSGAPDFAYDLCARNASNWDCSTLDLSSWRVAFNGSEPVREATMRSFAEAFEPFGFRRESFFPCYGLAEATLLVSGAKATSALSVRTVQAEALKHNSVIETEHNRRRGLTLVACGRAPETQQVLIVDPKTITPSPSDRVGEIWVRGPSVAAGYYNRIEETKRTFQAYLLGTNQGPFLRTGDLGFIKDGELFVTGRIKDLIIIRGQNYYPHDIELTVQRICNTTPPIVSAVFSANAKGRERLIIVVEVGNRRELDADEIIMAVRRAVAEEHQLQAYAIILVRKGGIPKTSSGKIRRGSCREAFLEGKLKLVAQWIDSSSEEKWDPSLELSVTPDGVEEAKKLLARLLSAKLGIDAGSINLDRPISFYGLDSLAAVELIHKIEVSLGVAIPISMFFQATSISELAELAQSLIKEVTPLDAIFEEQGKNVTEFGLSFGQQAIYFLHQLAPVPANNLSALGIVRGPLDVVAFSEAFQKLTDRHACLRTVFLSTPNGPVQRIREGIRAYFREVAAASWSEQELNHHISEEAGHRFDLEKERLLRVTLYRRRTQVLLQITAHHIAVDLWSMALLLKELGTLYSRLSNADLPPLTSHYSDYVAWQAEMAASAEGHQLWEYWKRKLDGELPVLDLQTDRPRPPIRTYSCGLQNFRIPSELVIGLERLGRNCGATLFMSLAGVFEVLLNRYTGQKDVLLGALTNGRNQAKFAETVGYFVNPIVLRGDFSGRQSFDSFLSAIKTTILEALQRQDYPFPLLVDKLQVRRDAARPPLLQVMFFYQKAHLRDQDALSLLAAGDHGGVVKIGDIEVEFLPLKPVVTQFDLTLKIAKTDDVSYGLAASLEYNSDLFDASTVMRLIDHFLVLMEGCFQYSRVAISDFPLIRGAARNQLIFEWNDTAYDNGAISRLHTLIETQVDRTPDAVAVMSGEEQITYAELNRKANQVAHYLMRNGCGPESRVGIYLNRCVEMMIGLLGILKSGGAYIPLDPTLPKERLAQMIIDSEVSAIVTRRRMTAALPPNEAYLALLDTQWDLISNENDANPTSSVCPENIAYVIYTSGSTGRPKGVMVSQRNVSEFFSAMDERLGVEPGVWLAVTGISFDISVLELLWTVSRGFMVIIQPEQDRYQHRPNRCGDRQDKEVEFSLFYFASDDCEVADDRYKLLFEGAKFADRKGFSAVWTPERHFHAFGGLYPNPSVTGAALAAITQNVAIRAGSVVLPLHNPLRVAEEWAVVDNISKGRAGISVASGWHADDFILSPESYSDRKELMLRNIEIVRKLWRGESVSLRGGAGNEVEVAIFPRPVQRALPLWMTAAGNVETFKLAGVIGANLLTHLLGQDLDDLSHKISIYRKAFLEGGHGPGDGHVTLMAHTFIGDSISEVRAKVRGPFCSYLLSSYGLIKNLARSLGKNIDSDNFTQDDKEALLSNAFDRYFNTSGLMGTLTTCLETVNHMKAIGVDEIACLIDFGVDIDSTLRGLEYLARLKSLANERRSARNETYSIPAQIKRHGVTHLQCTPSTARMIAYDPASLDSLQSLEKFLVGGETLPASLAQGLRKVTDRDLRNMYGPTETTIWSANDVIDKSVAGVTIGRPIRNTEFYILDQELEPAPIGVASNVYIGGAGVVRGYLNSPELTAEKFIPDPHSGRSGSRLYLTGDVSRFLNDGKIDFLGRADRQIKLRGYRIELGEIEVALELHPAIRQAAVILREERGGDHRLAAYIECEPGSTLTASETREFLADRLPEYMIPADFVMLESLPMTTTGKINRKGLPLLEQSRGDVERTVEAPGNPVEEAIAGIWSDILGIDEVGIHDNFFESGGNSILAFQLVTRLRDIFKIELPLRTFFTAPTVSGLAGIMTKGPEQEFKVRRIAELLIKMANCTDDEAEAMMEDRKALSDDHLRDRGNETYT